MSDLETVKDIVKMVFERHKPNKTGKVAQYIPELAQADPEPFGIAVATVNKKLITEGDVDTPFSIQSISKPFVFGKTLEECGEKKTFAHVGTEPSGEAFNAIELDPGTHRPYNPMVNAGAISITSLLYDTFKEKSEDEIIKLFSDLSGEAVSVNEKLYESELGTADRNRALAYLMRSVGLNSPPIEEKVALYTRQCSVNITTKQLAIMAATLANIGKNPFTEVTVYSPKTVRNILSVMFTCGMYDFAGRWAVDVGLPAKSGVSGGVMAVVNRQIGIGIFSPRLDERGNSVRAIAACVDLAEELGLHAFEFTNIGSGMLGIYMN